MLNLLAKVSLDSSGFTQGLSKMATAVAPVGAHIGNQIRSKMLEAFGAGAAIAAFKKTMQNALDIKSGATRMGMDTGTFQVLSSVAKSAGMSVEDLAKQLESGELASTGLSDAIAKARSEMEKTGQIIDDRTLQRLLETADKFNSVFGRMAPVLAQMTDFLLKIGESFFKLFVQMPMAAGAVGVGKAFGNERLIEAGKAMGKDAMTPSWMGSDGKTEVRKAAEIAAEVVRASDEKDGSSRKSGSAADKSPQVSSLVAAGAVFTGGPGNRTMDTVRNDVTRIRQLMERGRD